MYQRLWAVLIGNLFINNLVNKAEERHVTLIHNTCDVTSIWQSGHMMKIMSGKV
jgi:hypothetical protein